MSHPNKKLMTASAAMVGLSAFVPNPLLTNDAMAQATATVSLSIKASVTNPLNLKAGTELDFGTFAIATTGSVVIKAAGTQSISGGFTITAGHVGTLKVTAPKSATFTLSVTNFAASSIILKTTGGGGAGTKEMTLSNLFLGIGSKIVGAVGTLSKGAETLPSIKVTGTTNKGVIDIGGTLLFDKAQVTGDYSASYKVLITF